MRNKTIVFIVIYIFTVLIAKSYMKKINMYDFLNIFFGATLFCVFNGLRLIYIKKPFKFEDVILMAIVIFSADLLKGVILAYLFPEADKNKDGMVTANEFYLWKDKIEKEIVAQSQ